MDFRLKPDMMNIFISTSCGAHMRIGTLVKQRRENCGWTQSQLAERTANAVTQSALSRIEAGEDNVTIETLRALAKAFGCLVVDLLPDDDKRKRSRRSA